MSLASRQYSTFKIPTIYESNQGEGFAWPQTLHKCSRNSIFFWFFGHSEFSNSHVVNFVHNFERTPLHNEVKNARILTYILFCLELLNACKTSFYRQSSSLWQYRGHNAIESNEVLIVKIFAHDSHSHLELKEVPLNFAQKSHFTSRGQNQNSTGK